MKEKYVKLEKSVQNYSADELKEKLGNLKKSELMRSIILNEKDFCNCDYERSQRSFWYSTVKPTLDKLGKLTADDNTEEGLSNWDKVLSKYLSELVKEGKLTYKDLKIVDESRKLNIPSYYSFSPYRNIVVCCEKDTIYNIVNDISRLLGCSCISTKGLNGFGAMETLLRRIKDNSENKIEELIFLILSDYDPTGYTISNTINEQAINMVETLGINCKITCQRIGIVPSQLTETEVKNNMYTPKKKGMDKWMEETGGINGMEKGLELDALIPDRIREIFANNLEKYIDSSVYYEEEGKSFLKQKIRSALNDYISVIIEDVSDKMIGKVELIQEYNILDYLKQGKVWIPDEENYYVDEAEITECIKQYFV